MSRKEIKANASQVVFVVTTRRCYEYRGEGKVRRRCHDSEFSGRWSITIIFTLRVARSGVMQQNGDLDPRSAESCLVSG